MSENPYQAPASVSVPAASAPRWFFKKTWTRILVAGFACAAYSSTPYRVFPFTGPIAYAIYFTAWVSLPLLWILLPKIWRPGGWSGLTWAYALATLVLFFATWVLAMLSIDNLARLFGVDLQG